MKLTINSQQVKGRACQIIQALSLDKPMRLTLVEYRKNKSAQQRGLQWKWYTHISGETGETKEEVHHRYKLRFAVPIFERDDEQYAETMATLRVVYKTGAEVEALKLHRHIVRETSTEDFTVPQMAEYLESIDRDCLSVGIFLPQPEDLGRFE